MTAGIANETRLATLAFRTARALLTTSFTAAASVTLSVEFTEFGDRIAYSEDFTVGHLRSGQSRLRAYIVAVSMKFPCAGQLCILE
jgi:hypothetical protein